MFRKIFTYLSATIVLLAIAFVIFVWWALQPRPDPQPLPEELISAVTPQGQILLSEADASADYPPLSRHFTAQELKSFCGVASGATVLSALGRNLDQDAFFSDEASRVRSRLRVTLGGMTLSDLGDLLRAHGAIVSVHHADSFDVEELREVVASNLAQSGDYLIVNYQREVLGQNRVGHISPLAAYDRESDLVLVMDTASHYYPYSWVPLGKLYEAMATTDTSSGRMRGYLEVAGLSGGS